MIRFGNQMSEQKYHQLDKLYNGHSVFELNCKTKQLKTVAYETYKDVFGKSKARVVVNDNCLYTTALNEKNAANKFKMFLETLPLKA